MFFVQFILNKLTGVICDWHQVLQSLLFCLALKTINTLEIARAYRLACDQIVKNFEFTRFDFSAIEFTRKIKLELLTNLYLSYYNFKKDINLTSSHIFDSFWKVVSAKLTIHVLQQVLTERLMSLEFRTFQPLPLSYFGSHFTKSSSDFVA